MWLDPEHAEPSPRADHAVLSEHVEPLRICPDVCLPKLIIRQLASRWKYVRAQPQSGWIPIDIYLDFLIEEELAARCPEGIPWIHRLVVELDLHHWSVIRAGQIADVGQSEMTPEGLDCL